MKSSLLKLCDMSVITDTIQISEGCESSRNGSWWWCLIWWNSYTQCLRNCNRWEDGEMARPTERCIRPILEFSLFQRGTTNNKGKMSKQMHAQWCIILVLFIAFRWIVPKGMIQMFLPVIRTLFLSVGRGSNI